MPCSFSFGDVALKVSISIPFKENNAKKNLKFDILDLATKKNPCQPHKILLAWERCSCFPALSDGVVLAKWRVSIK